MPFKSKKQRKWMHVNKPEMAKDWEKKLAYSDRKEKKDKKMKKEQKAKNYIKKMVREELNKINETLPNKVTDKFKNLKDKPKSKAAKAFQIQHATSMADGEQGTIAEPDTYDWDDDMDDKPGYQSNEKDKKKYGYEPVKEDFAGSYPKHVRKKFDKKRQKQSEVLGYKLTGTPDVKTEIGDATVKEAKERNYKEEYKKYGSSKKAKKYRAELNAYNRKKGTYGNGDGKDASHKGGKIVGFEAESKNRGRAEKSRLKKEGKLNEFNKAHFLNLIKQEVDSLKGQVAYAKDKVNYKGTPDWEKKEFKGVLKDLLKKLKDTEKHYKKVQKLKEGKLTEGKGVDKVLDMANNNSFGKLGGKTVDAMSANLFKTVYDKLTGSNKEKIDKMNEKQLYVFMTKLWTKFGKQVRI